MRDGNSGFLICEISANLLNAQNFIQDATRLSRRCLLAAATRSYHLPLQHQHCLHQLLFVTTPTLWNNRRSGYVPKVFQTRLCQARGSGAETSFQFMRSAQIQPDGTFCRVALQLPTKPLPSRSFSSQGPIQASKRVSRYLLEFCRRSRRGGRRGRIIMRPNPTHRQYLMSPAMSSVWRLLWCRCISSGVILVYSDQMSCFHKNQAVQKALSRIYSSSAGIEMVPWQRTGPGESMEYHRGLCGVHCLPWV